MKLLHGRTIVATLALWTIACGSQQPVPSETDRIMASPRPAWCAEPPRPVYAQLSRVDSPSAWFEVYRIDDGVFALYEPHQFEEVISYLLLGSERALLFDSGLGIGPIRQVVHSLTALPVVVFNSHSHLDHVGGNAEFERILGLDTEYGRANSAGLPNSAVREVLDPAALCADLPSGAAIDTYHIRPYSIAEFVADGTKIDLGGRVLEVIATPGHTPDAAMLLDRVNGLLLTGDSFYEGPIYLFAPETDAPAYRRSIRKVAELVPELRWLLPAHNSARSDPSLLVQLADALEKIDAGKAAGTLEGERIAYEFERFSVVEQLR